MKIVVAQARPFTGDIRANIERHIQLIELAVEHAADVVVFPELSLTGYEPTLAKDLATTADDPRLDVFQEMSDLHAVTIGVGLPTKSELRPCISLVCFRPQAPRDVYSKQYLHADEEPYFAAGPSCAGLLAGHPNIALAICYELSVPAHTEAAASNGADIYLASVAKFASGVEQAYERLAEIARTYSIPVLMANGVGPADGGMCTGNSAVWNEQGELLGQLDDTSEGVLVFDTETEEIDILAM